MRKLLVAAGALSVLAGVLWFVGPWAFLAYLETSLLVECSGAQPDETCISRMRGMGNLWTLKDAPELAEAWYRRGADRGDADSMFELGWLYEMRALDRVKAAVREAALQERAQQQALGGDAADAMASFRTAEEIAAIARHANDWYRRAAEKGFAPAMNNLGELRRLGLGGDPDLEEAFHWYMAAAKAGNPAGAWNVATAYMFGDGVPRDPEEARKWMRWNPAGAGRRDLLAPTLERTTVFGGPIPANYLAIVRAAASVGSPVTLEMYPLQPSAAIPQFHPVQSGSQSPPARP